MQPSALAVVLLASLAALPRSAPHQEGQPAPRFTFSEGPFERTWALVDPEQAPRALGPERLPPTNVAQRETETTWLRWAAAVRAAAVRDDASAERLWLAAFARAQGRHDDAWEHLAHAGDDPFGLCAVAPLMTPGVEPGALSSWPALPDGALLAPALPPPDRPAAEILLGTGRLRRGSARVERFGVGAAQLALSIQVEGDGVQLDLEHLGGGPARVRVLLPEPPDFELRSEYLDWGRLEGVRQEREIELVPGGEVRSLFGRYRPRRLEWPVQVPPGLGARLERDGLRLLVLSASTSVGLAQGLEALLDIDVGVRELARPAVPDPFGGVQVDLRDGASAAAKRAALVGVAERFVLSGPR